MKLSVLTRIGMLFRILKSLMLLFCPILVDNYFRSLYRYDPHADGKFYTVIVDVCKLQATLTSGAGQVSFSLI